MDRWDASADLAKGGIGFLVHGVLDYIVDSHFEAVHALDRSSRWRTGCSPITSTWCRWWVVLPMREVVNSLLRRDHQVVDETLMPYMKKVTGWAAIIAVPTAITGFYGQNVPYPGFDRPWGFSFSTGVIVVLSGALYVMFERRDWL